MKRASAAWIPIAPAAMQAKVTFALALAGVCSLAFAGACWSAPLSAQHQNGSEDLFADGKIRTFKIEMTEPALIALKKNERSYVAATITEGTNVLRDVGVHLKGMGSFQPLGQKPSFALKFDKFRRDQAYLGLNRILLN